MSKKMSVNVTINGNPVCVRPSQMFLSDTEQIKKNERERRRRLRLEQVRQQSKKLSSEVLKRAKNAAKKEINKWEKDCKSELRKMHDQKIMEIQRKIQEDMDDIGLAHNSAALQPNADEIIEAERQNDRLRAAERGKEATQRLKECSQKPDPTALHQERLRQVREVENIRSSMVAQLPNKTSVPKDNEKDTNSSEENEVVGEKSIAASPKKKTHKKLVGKKSPGKVVSKSNVKVVGQHRKGKTTKRVVVEVHRENSKSPKRASTSKARKSSDATSESSEKTRKTETEIECTNPSCNPGGEELEPRKNVPSVKLTPTKADKVARYNPNDYKQKTSDSNSSSSSSVSDDSSYFSDGCSELLIPKTTCNAKKSILSNKVQLYDHSTRQRNSYDQPIGLVERLDIRSEPNAVEAARELIEAENLAASLLESRRIAAQKREDDLMLRERVRRDYSEMLKNSENKARSERIEKSTICTNQHARESRRKNYETERRGGEAPVCEIIIHDTEQPGPSQLADFEERARRTCCRDERDRATVCSGSCRHEEPIHERPTFCVKHDSAEEVLKTWSNIEWIKKIEQQKRLLLREFGADLPSTIFNASMTPLFENRPSLANQQQPTTSSARAPSPEIKTINMSSSDEAAKKTSVAKKKSKKAKSPVLKTTETAVQTATMDEIGAAKDKSVQVEILSEQLRESRRKSLSPRSETPASANLEYVEPRVVVLSPPDVGNSSSGSSISRDIVIELDNHQVKVTPKKRKSGLEKSTKRRSPGRSKPRSLPTSHPGSPVKKHPTSAPSSRSSSPKKHDSGRSTRSRTPDKVVDILVHKGSVKVQTTAIPDSSLESTMPDSSPEVQENPPTTSGKTYRIFKHPTVKKASETSRDTSDTSTSYASLPTKLAPRYPVPRHQITPILEMLDSSANESLRAGRMNVSPVSTPGTPSPRTINVPSNMPHPERIGRFLKFDNSTIEGTPGPNSDVFSSTQRENSSSTDPSYPSQSRDQRPVADLRKIDSRRSNKSSDFCSCANPACQLLHDNINDIREYATTNHPEVLEKYKDLQNVCTERIASLTELIQRVRNEQRGMEFSMISPADETSLMQLPPPKPYRSDFQSVQRLVESIEAIHSKLARTLRESQKIITGGTMQNPEASPNPEGPACSTSYETKSKGSTSTSTEETPIPLYSSKSKPIVVSNEAVKIDLDRLKRGRGPYTTMLVTTDNNSWPSPGTPRRHEEIVAKLYQEILEQSKTVDNSRERSGEGSFSGRRTPSPPQNLSTARKQNSPREISEEAEVTKDERQSPRPKKDEEFVPLLAGIPKIARALPSVQTGTRPRPPPAGKSYRSELGSPVHELSTIVEFDTPDTVNRSQGSTKSATGKSRRILQLQSPAKSSPRSERNAKTQTGSDARFSSVGRSTITENMARAQPRKLAMRDAASPDDKFVLNSDNDRAVSERGTTKSLLSQGRNESLEGARTNGDGKSVEYLESDKGKSEEKQERETSKAESYETIDSKLAALLSSKLRMDSGLGNENKTEKLTSTSSTSFSGLSGISEIVTSPTSDLVKWASSSEEIETALKKMGLGWAIVTLKKTREASALSSSSNSDLTPMNIARRTKSPTKKSIGDENLCNLPDFISDVSSISIKEASKSTERAVLMKARTSTPNIQNSNSTSEKSASATTSSSGISVQDHSDSLTAPNLSLNNNKR